MLPFFSVNKDVCISEAWKCVYIHVQKIGLRKEASKTQGF